MEKKKNNPENFEEEVYEIDLLELYYAAKQKIALILICGLLFGGIVGIYTITMVKPIYTSTASMLVLSKETTLTSIADLQLGTQLASDYKVLIKSTTVMEKVIENLDLDVEVEELKESIGIENPTDTRILELSVENEDPMTAKAIVDEILEVSSEYIGDKMEVIPPKAIETGKVAVEQTSPNIKKNIVLGFLLGILFPVVIIAVMTVMDDTIKSEDDMNKYLGISVLAAIPDRKDYINIQVKKEKRKKKRNDEGRG